MRLHDYEFLKKVLQERLINSTSESEDAHTAILLGEIEGEIVRLKTPNNVFSRDECVFDYCPTPELCQNKCNAGY